MIFELVRPLSTVRCSAAPVTTETSFPGSVRVLADSVFAMMALTTIGLFAARSQSPRGSALRLNEASPAHRESDVALSGESGECHWRW